MFYKIFRTINKVDGGGNFGVGFGDADGAQGYHTATWAGVDNKRVTSYSGQLAIMNAEVFEILTRTADLQGSTILVTAIGSEPVCNEVCSSGGGVNEGSYCDSDGPCCCPPLSCIEHICTGCVAEPNDCNVDGDCPSRSCVLTSYFV